MTRRIDPSLIPAAPDLSFEHALWKKGLINIAGIDEAGRGCLAGPVTAGCSDSPSNERSSRLFFHYSGFQAALSRGKEMGAKKNRRELFGLGGRQCFKS